MASKKHVPTGADMAAIMQREIEKRWESMSYDERYAFETARRLLDPRCGTCIYHNDKRVLVNGRNSIRIAYRCMNPESVMKYKTTREDLKCEEWAIEDVETWLKEHVEDYREL